MWPFSKYIGYRYRLVEGIDFEKVDHPRWKARVLRTIKVTLPEIPKWYEVSTQYFKIKDGVLTIRKGYSWDLASGPVFNTPTNYRASLVHDVLYQCIRECIFPQPLLTKEEASKDRKRADKVLRRIMKEDGAFAFRAWYWYSAVRLRGAKHAAPFCYYMEKTDEKVLTNYTDTID